MKRDGKLILVIVLLLALQAALTAGLQVWGLEPAWTGNWRIIKSVLAAVNWGVGLCAAFYLRARWPNWFAWVVVVLGVLAVGAFYSSWYSSWAELTRWVGLAYGLLMAAFDASIVGYGLTVIGREGKADDAEVQQEREAQRQLALSDAETKRLRAERALVKAQQPQAQMTVTKRVTKRVALSGAAATSGAYICDCGRTFTLPQAFSGHVRFCRVYAEKREALALEERRGA